MAQSRNDPARPPGYASVWCREMNALLAGGDPFVPIYDGRRHDEGTPLVKAAVESIALSGEV